MPRLQAQLESSPRDQEFNLVAFVGEALTASSPNKETLYHMVRQACDHEELVRLEELLRVPDQQTRGFMFLSLIGVVIARCSIDLAIRHHEGTP